jgi:hypothetical protein
MMDVGFFPRGTPIGQIPPINESESCAGPHGLTLVMGFHVPVMQSVAAEHDIALVWPCAVVGYGNGEGALIGVLHQFDDVGGEVVILSYGVRVTREVLRDANRRCAELASGGILELRVRLPVAAYKLHRRARRFGFSWVERVNGEDVFSISTRDFCKLGRDRSDATAPSASQDRWLH